MFLLVVVVVDWDPPEEPAEETEWVPTRRSIPRWMLSHYSPVPVCTLPKYTVGD